MIDIEDRLRDAFRAEAETVSPQSLRTLPAPGTRARRPRTARPAVARRRRLLAPLAAAAAVTAITVAITTLIPRAGGSSPAASLPAGVPHFYVFSSFKPGDSPVIRSTATGHVTGTLRVPRGQQVGAVAPLAGDDSFLALVGPLAGHRGPERLEQFSISKNGKPGALRPLSITVPSPNPEFAVTPDGHAIAFYTTSPALGSTRGHDSSSQVKIEVVNRLTGRTRTWTGCTCQVYADSPFTLSLSASGRLLAAQPLSGSPLYGYFGVRLLRTGSAPGSYTRHSRLVLPDAYWATLSPSGSTLYACLSSPGLRLSTWVAYSVATGQRHIIARWRGALYRDGGGCAATASASGRYLLVQLADFAKHKETGEVLDTRTGRVIPLHHRHVNGSVSW